MEIKVLGTGCAGCKALYAIVTQVVKRISLGSGSNQRRRFDEDYGIQCNDASCSCRGR